MEKKSRFESQLNSLEQANRGFLEARKGATKRASFVSAVAAAATIAPSGEAAIIMIDPGAQTVLWSFNPAAIGAQYAVGAVDLDGASGADLAFVANFSVAGGVFARAAAFLETTAPAAPTSAPNAVGLYGGPGPFANGMSTVPSGFLISFTNRSFARQHGGSYPTGGGPNEGIYGAFPFPPIAPGSTGFGTGLIGVQGSGPQKLDR